MPTSYSRIMLDRESIPDEEKPPPELVQAAQDLSELLNTTVANFWNERFPEKGIEVNATVTAITAELMALLSDQEVTKRMSIADHISTALVDGVDEEVGKRELGHIKVRTD